MTSPEHSLETPPRADRFRIAGLQFDVRRGDFAENFRIAAEALPAMADRGTRLVLLPEMWSCGFDYDRLRECAEETPRVLDRVGELAIRHRMLIGGSYPERTGDDRVFNTFFLIDADGRTVGRYRKVHLFSMTGEDRFFDRGNRPAVCDTALGRVGLMVCYDLRFPELCRTLALMGAELVLVPAQWPQVRIDRWELLCQARAMENQLYLLGINRCGADGRTSFGGRSMLVDPTGAVVDRAGDGPAVVGGEIEPDRVADVRRKMPCLDERVPEAYRVPEAGDACAGDLGAELRPLFPPEDGCGAADSAAKSPGRNA